MSQQTHADALSYFQETFTSLNVDLLCFKESDVYKAFRTLSRVQHPDKVPYEQRNEATRQQQILVDYRDILIEHLHTPCDNDSKSHTYDYSASDSDSESSFSFDQSNDKTSNKTTQDQSPKQDQTTNKKTNNTKQDKTPKKTTNKSKQDKTNNKTTNRTKDYQTKSKANKTNNTNNTNNTNDRTSYTQSDQPNKNTTTANFNVREGVFEDKSNDPIPHYFKFVKSTHGQPRKLYHNKQPVVDQNDAFIFLHTVTIDHFNNFPDALKRSYDKCARAVYYQDKRTREEKQSKTNFAFESENRSETRSENRSETTTNSFGCSSPSPSKHQQSQTNDNSKRRKLSDLKSDLKSTYDRVFAALGQAMAQQLTELRKKNEDVIREAMISISAKISQNNQQTEVNLRDLVSKFT